MPLYHGSCHCGAVRFSYQGDSVEKGLRCNCSICRRKGAVMSSEIISPEQITIEADEGQLGLYQFDTEVAKHYFCKQCGIYPFHETVRKPGHYRVNLGCIDEIDTFALEVDLFDGKHLL